MPLKHFGLREEPFGVAPDPRFLFFGNGHREAISALYARILEGRSAALLLAHPGMGKTTLLNYLRARLAAVADMVVLSNFANSRSGLLHEVTSLLGCEALEDNVGENWRRLQRVLIERSRLGRRVVLICDDAQSLSHEALEDLNLLCNCELPQQKLIQIVLAGQPGLVPRLRVPRHESLTQRIGVFSHVLPLPPDEIDLYIEHRLRVAGATREIFTPEARLAVARFSDGVPLRINTICRAALVDSCLARRQQVEPDVVEEAASDLLDSVYPAQVVEEAVWAQLAPRGAALAPPAEPRANALEGEELTRDDILRRVRTLGKQVVMLKQLGDTTAASSAPEDPNAGVASLASAAAGSLAARAPQASRGFELLQRMQRDGDLFGPDLPQQPIAPTAPGNGRDPIPPWALPAPSTAGSPEAALASDPDWRALKSRLLAAARHEAGRSIALSAAGRGESAAIVLLMLARHFAQQLGSKVLVVEAHGRVLARILGLRPAPGLDTWVRSTTEDPTALAQPTGLENVWVLTAGEDPEAVRAALGTPRFAELEAKLRSAFGMVLFEFPPASDPRQPLDVYARADTVVLAAKPGSSRVRDVERALRRLSGARVNVAGTILDDIELWTQDDGSAGPIQRLLRVWRARRPIHGRSTHPVTPEGRPDAVRDHPGIGHGTTETVLHAADA